MKKITPSSTLGKKLINYTSLAGALAGVSEASGQIIYTDINPDYAGGNDSVYMIDLDGDGTNDFKIHQTHSYYNWYGYIYSSNYLFMQPLVAGNSILGSLGGYSYQFAYPFAMNAGDTISGGLTSWNNNSYSSGFTSLNWAGLFGNFIGVTDKYLGVRFSISGATHYGWIRMDVNTSGSSWVVKDYAYNTTADAPIEAGQTTLATANYDVANSVKITSLNKSIALFNLPENTNYKLISITGQTVKSGNLSNTDTYTIEADNSIASGVYIVEVQDTDTNGVYRKKVIL